jgi:hypothetical protein
MAKPLTSIQPTSAVARLLEPGVAQAALREAPRPDDRAGARAEPAAPAVKREFSLTPPADAALRQLVDVLGRATGTQVTHSHLLRALLRGVAQSLPGIEAEAQKVGRLRRPSNARGREAERERYEAALAGALLAGIRRQP